MKKVKKKEKKKEILVVSTILLITMIVQILQFIPFTKNEINLGKGKKFNFQTSATTQDPEKIKEQITELESKIDKTSEELKQISDLKAQLDEINSQIESKTNEVNQTDEQIKKLETDLEAKESELETAKSELTPEKKEQINTEIQDLKTQKTAKEQRKAELEARQKALVTEIEESKKQAQSQWDKGSKGFFEKENATEAVAIFESAENAALLEFTELGAEKDATNLDNMKLSFEFIKKADALRMAGDENFPPKTENLKITHELMAAAQINTNYGDKQMGHSGYFSPSMRAENLAWGHSNPFDGWYTKEKEIYDYKKDNPGATQEELEEKFGPFLSTGHYTNIMSGHGHTGYARIASGSNRYGSADGQVFGGASGTPYSIADYENLFNTYYNSLKAEKEQGKKELLDEKTKIAEELAALDKEMQQIDSQITAKNEELNKVANLEAEIQKIKDQIAELNAKKDVLNKEIEELKAKVAELEKQIEPESDLVAENKKNIELLAALKLQIKELVKTTVGKSTDTKVVEGKSEEMKSTTGNPATGSKIYIAVMILILSASMIYGINRSFKNENK